MRENPAMLVRVLGPLSVPDATGDPIPVCGGPEVRAPLAPDRHLGWHVPRPEALNQAAW
ncbi:hypothetical protein [Streptomyces sp. NBC_00572]|uniref:hypothetical protein n=1 Tax=Streptomyces sp. NBC_00572 TaxID=2903664 RepID=UPI0022514AEC|nr:hypothetical protein [Streptomyces sp. NBC_00572]MCX4981460.1 hypothetical protein [Streptomyces sp. NBC_00572]